MDPIDRELASLLSVEPSPEFRARVRMRIATEPAPRASFPLWRAAACGVAVLSIVTAMVVGRRQQTGRTRRDVVLTASSSGASGLSPTIDSLPRAVVAAPATSGRAPNRRPRQRRPAEILVAASEVRGLRELAAIVHEGRTQFIFSNEHASDTIEPVGDILIAPLAVMPIEISEIPDFGMAEGDEQ